MSVPGAVWNEIKALEQAHAELAAKADALTPNDEGMHTLPEKTAAQERYHEANERHYSNREVEMAAGAFDRAEEVAQELDDWTHLIHMRLNTMSQRNASLESPAPAPDPVCANCEHPANDHHSLCWHRLDSGDVCGCKAFVPTAGPAPLDPVRMNLSEVVLSYVSMCGVRAWDEYGGRMIEIFGDGQSIQSLYIKNDSRQEIADLILGRDGAR